jgi:hypothetical protein
MIDRDIQDIEHEISSQATALGAPFTAAKAIYTNGSNSIQNASILHSLAGFVIDASKPFGKLYDEYKSIKNIDPHSTVSAALEGKGGPFGDFATGEKAKERNFRIKVVKNVLMNQIIKSDGGNCLLQFRRRAQTWEGEAAEPPTSC